MTENNLQEFLNSLTGDAKKYVELLLKHIEVLNQKNELLEERIRLLEEQKDIKSLAETEVCEYHGRKPIQKPDLEEVKKYLTDDMSQTQKCYVICNIYNVSYPTAYNWMRDWGFIKKHKKANYKDLQKVISDAKREIFEETEKVDSKTNKLGLNQMRITTNELFGL